MKSMDPDQTEPYGAAQSWCRCCQRNFQNTTTDDKADDCSHLWQAVKVFETNKFCFRSNKGQLSLQEKLTSKNRPPSRITDTKMHASRYSEIKLGK